MGQCVGVSVARKEDDRLLRGRGRYTADIELPGMLEATVVRSSAAHAHIEVDASRARKAEGVVAVLTAADLHGKVEPFTRMAIRTPRDLEQKIGLMVAPYRTQVLADSVVYRVGEPIAVVIATDRYVAEDAAELVDVEYEPLPVVSDPEASLSTESPQLHHDVPGNVHARFRLSAGDADAAFASCDRTLGERFRIGRSIGAPVETRGCVAVWDPSGELLTVWSTTQRSHWLRGYMSEMLHIDEDRIRVIAPDMGGSFGSGLYGEDILIPFAARALGAPVRWVEDRQENLVNARHGRDQVHDMEIAYNDDGVIVGLRGRLIQDCGAYNPYAVTISYNTACNLRAEYDIENFDVEVLCVLTNKTANTPVRGAGRPEATFVIDRLVDMVADDLGADPADIREKNLVPAEKMPYDTGLIYRDGERMIYDSGDFPAQFRRALEILDLQTFRKEQASARKEGRFLGAGFSTYVEGSGIGPFESASVTVDTSGHVTIGSGSNPHGQSHETTLAQVCADALGVPYGRISLRAGDTSATSFGGGTNASRSAVTAGTAVHMAATSVREKVEIIVGRMLDVDPSDVAVEDGRAYPRDRPDRSVTLAEVARAAAPASGFLPEGMRPGLEEEGYFYPSAVTFASGTHAAVVEVDADTGAVRLLRYIVVDDCGRMLNPVIVDGQIHGGVAHGIGNALYEEAVFDEEGQPLTATFMDYLLPSAKEVPRIEVAHEEHPSPLNPLGVKGCGEGGTCSPPAAVANAVADALKPLRVRISECPLTPARLFAAIQEAKQRGGARETTQT